MRKDEILEILHMYNYATVHFLSNALHISASSVRRDLTAMEAQGLVKRSHGGVSIAEGNNALTPFPMRMKENSIAKRKICQKAAALINDDDVIFVDGSTTCLYLPEFIRDKNNITVLTNSLKLCEMLLGYQNVTVYSTGGSFHLRNEQVLVGPFAEHVCQNVHTNIMFFSARAISASGLITDLNEPETHVRHVALENTERPVFLCDRSKFNKSSTFSVCRAQDISCIITDEPPAKDMISLWNAREVL